MSRPVRFAAALLTLAALTCGSLGALPLGFRSTPTETARGDFLTAVVEWIASLFGPGHPAGGAAEQPQPKDSGTMDPNGGGGGH